MNKALEILYADYSQSKIGMLSKHYLLIHGATDMDIEQADNNGWIICADKHYDKFQSIFITTDGVNAYEQWIGKKLDEIL